MQKPIVDMLVWMRVPGGDVFSIGAVALAWLVVRLWIGPRPAAACRRTPADPGLGEGRPGTATRPRMEQEPSGRKSEGPGLPGPSLEDGGPGAT